MHANAVRPEFLALAARTGSFLISPVKMGLLGFLAGVGIFEISIVDTMKPWSSAIISMVVLVDLALSMAV
jgi:hypothetical protein